MKKVAECVTAKLDQNQMMARLGGDEFAIIATNLSNPMTAGRIVEEVIEATRAENETSTTAALVSTGEVIIGDATTDQ